MREPTFPQEFNTVKLKELFEHKFVPLMFINMFLSRQLVRFTRKQ